MGRQNHRLPRHAEARVAPGPLSAVSGCLPVAVGAQTVLHAPAEVLAGFAVGGTARPAITHHLTVILVQSHLWLLPRPAGPCPRRSALVLAVANAGWPNALRWAVRGENEGRGGVSASRDLVRLALGECQRCATLEEGQRRRHDEGKRLRREIFARMAHPADAGQISASWRSGSGASIGRARRSAISTCSAKRRTRASIGWLTPRSR